MSAAPPVSSTPLRVRFGDFELDEANARLVRAGKVLSLSPTPFGLLCALARRPGSLLSKHALLDAAWGHRFVSDSVLKGAISDIRVVLEDDPRIPRFIETVPRRGYRFIAPTEALADGASAVSIARHTSTVALPTRPEFTGRTKELVRLSRCWERASRGERAIVWIVGEPGIGKTTLIEQFVATLGEARCARGQCVQHYGTGEPYLPVLDALGELCRRDSTLSELLRSVAPSWLVQLPWLSTADERELLRRELVGANPERMIRELGELLNRYTERTPLLLITEDLHWGDRATVQLIDHVARSRAAARLLWLSSFRVAEVVAQDHPLSAVRHELRLHSLCDEIVLDSFTEAEVAAYVAQHVPAQAEDEAFVRALHDRTDGVPLFVASVTAEMAARSALSGIPAAMLLKEAAVPESLTAIIDHYLKRLTTGRRQLLAAAAVCGDHFAADTLSRVLDRDPFEVAESCEELEREHLWLASPQADLKGRQASHACTFRHALFRQVLYDRTPVAARAELHRRVGEELERQRSAGSAIAPAELAMHFDRGRVPLAALTYYVEAARSALSQLSPAECLGLTERGLELLREAPEGTERASREIELSGLRGTAAYQQFGAGREALEALMRGAQRLSDVPLHPMRGVVLHSLGVLLTSGDEFDQARATADRAALLAADTGDPMLHVVAATVRGYVDMMQGCPLESRRALEAVIPLSGELPVSAERPFTFDPQVMMRTILGLQLVDLGAFAEWRELMAHSYARARGLGEPVSLMVTIWFDALCHVRLGDVATVEALADQMQTLVERYGLAQGRTASRFFRGWAVARSGRPREGFQMIIEAFEQNTALGMIAGGTEVLAYAVEALLLDGDVLGARVQLERAFALVARYGERIVLPQLLLLQSAISVAEGDTDGARVCARRAIEVARARGAAWLELLALTALCQLPGTTGEERDALAEQVALCAAAGEVPALSKARSLLHFG